MKTILLSITLCLIASSSYAQEEIKRTGKFIQEKTEYIHIIDGIEYPIYVSKRKNKIDKKGNEVTSHVSYYINLIDPKTGNIYTQLLEVSGIRNE